MYHKTLSISLLRGLAPKSLFSTLISRLTRDHHRDCNVYWDSVTRWNCLKAHVTSCMGKLDYDSSILSMLTLQPFCQSGKPWIHFLQTLIDYFFIHAWQGVNFLNKSGKPVSWLVITLPLIIMGESSFKLFSSSSDLFWLEPRIWIKIWTCWSLLRFQTFHPRRTCM